MSLTFLHTSPVHVATFETLVSDIDSNVNVQHHVSETLLADARQLGAESSDIIESVKQELQQLKQEGATLVVCTCSTIGGIVESMNAEDLPAQRIDRAMADTAVQTGPKISVLAALESTLEPTKQLIESSATKKNSSIDLSLHHITDAWQYFEANDQQSYWKTIAHHIAQQAKQKQPDVIVLAQASMANAMNYCNDIKTPILSSPSLGPIQIYQYFQTRWHLQKLLQKHL